MNPVAPVTSARPVTLLPLVCDRTTFPRQLSKHDKRGRHTPDPFARAGLGSVRKGAGSARIGRSRFVSEPYCGAAAGDARSPEGWARMLLGVHRVAGVVAGASERRVDIRLDRFHGIRVKRDVPSAGVDGPGALALPLVQRPGHVVLVVLGRLTRVEPDEIAPGGTVRRQVPGGLQELVRPEGGAGRVVGLVVVGALVVAHAPQVRMVVLWMDAAGGRVPGPHGRRRRGSWGRWGR